VSDPTSTGKPSTKDPGGQLLVTPAGTAIVSTDAMLASVDALRVLQAELVMDVRRALAADAVWAGMPISGVVPAIDRARDLCDQGRESLARAAAEYSEVERAISLLQHELGARVASLLGPAVFGLLLTLVVTNPGLLMAVALGGWAAIPDDGDGKLDTLRDFFRDHPELITSPEFVRFVSVVSTSADDAVPHPFGFPFGPTGGADAGALTVIGLGSVFGMFRETSVVAERVSTTTGGSAPVGVRDRLDRVPEDDLVRIEKYEAPGQPPRYAVFIGPTETFSPFAESEPRDLTSNVYGVAGLSPASLRAVEQAMADAGITGSDEVQVVGFSQGGLIATMIAGSGDWNVVGVETFAAPTGGIALPDGISGLAIRNTDDFVPALGGPQQDTHLVQVEREAFAGDGPIVTDQVVPAHQRTAYERTATAVDAAESSVIRIQIDKLDAFATDYLDAPGGTVTVMTYDATRVDGLTRQR
jgi:hypothetical protein